MYVCTCMCMCIYINTYIHVGMLRCVADREGNSFTFLNLTLKMKRHGQMLTLTFFWCSSWYFLSALVRCRPRGKQRDVFDSHLEDETPWPDAGLDCLMVFQRDCIAVFQPILPLCS